MVAGLGEVRVNYTREYIVVAQFPVQVLWALIDSGKDC